MVSVTTALLLAISPSNASAQVDWARTATSGDWGDGAWSNSNGVPVGSGPAAFDNVYLGDSAFPGGSGAGSPTGEIALEVKNANRAALNITLGGTGTDLGILNLTNFGVSVGNDVTINNGSEINLLTGDSVFLSVVNDITINDGSISSSDGKILSATNLVLNSASATATLSGTTNISNDLDLAVGSILTLDSTSLVDVNGTLDIDGSLNLNGGTLSATNFTISSSGTLNQAGGNFDVDALVIDAAETVTIQDGDSVTDSVSLSSGASLIFAQAANQTDGIALNTLDIEAGSSFEVNFDAATVINTGDWVLSLAGNQESKLRGFVDDGRIFTTQFDHASSSTLGPLKLYATYDGGSDVTFLTAIPEPATSIWILLIGGIAGVRRRR